MIHLNEFPAILPEKNSNVQKISFVTNIAETALKELEWPALETNFTGIPESG